MNRPSPNDEQVREDLVAFLDGELDEELSRRVEVGIHTSPEVRGEAESLRRTWELLDFLPRAEPSATFTQRTLDRIKPISGDAGPARRGTWWKRGACSLAWAASLLLSTLAGYAGYQYFHPQQPGDRELIHDLRIIENLRLYELVEDLDYLKELDQPDLFGEERGS